MRPLRGEPARTRAYPRRPAFWLLVFTFSLPVEASRLKAILLRRLGARVAQGVRFGRRSTILCRRYDETSIGPFTKFGERCRIVARSITTGEDSRIDAEVWVRGRDSLRIGRSCYIGARTYVDVNREVTVEDDAGIGPGCWIFTHSVWQSVLDGGPRLFAPVHIGRNVWIPASVFIMPGVKVGEGAIVGARSLVTSDVPPGVFAAGSPAKVIRGATERAMEQPSPAERRALLGLVMEEFAELLADERLGEVLQRDTRGAIELYHVGKERPFAVVAVCHERLRTDHLRAVEASTWVAVTGIDASAVPNLAGRAWFDLETKRRSRDRGPVNQLLHEVFRGEFGIRFRFAE